MSGSRLSISARLALWYGLSLLVLLGAFVVFLYTSFHVGLHADFEAQLRRDEAFVQGAVRVDDGPVRIDEDRALLEVPLRTRGPAGTYVRLLAQDGTVLYRSPNMAPGPTLASAIPEGQANSTIVREWEGAPARSRYVRLTDERGDGATWIEVTRLESALHDELHRLRWLLALGVLVCSGVAIVVGHRLSHRALRPVSAMIGAANEMGAGSRGRLPQDFGVRDELTELAETLNELLSRLDDSIDREQRFRADAAHEMLTPIAALQSEIEVAQRRPRETGYHEETLGRLAGHVDRLGRVVEGLLTLSRAEVGDTDPSARCDASACVEETCAGLAPVARSRDVALRWEVAPSAPVAMSAEFLETLVQNLVDNAIKYTPPGGSVTVTLDSRPDAFDLRVSDTGAGLSDVEAARVFDRFFRSERAAVREVRGNGLGLSIARAIAQSHGATLRASSDGPGKGSRFEVGLPRWTGQT